MSAHTEVKEAIAALGLSNVVSHEPSEEQRLYARLEQRFCNRPGARWLWEHFCVPFSSRSFPQNREWLTSVVPDHQARLLLFMDSDEVDVCVVEATARDIVAILEECSLCEFCVAPPELDWMICENHHDTIYAVGSAVRERLAAL